MRVAIAADHAGYFLKAYLVPYLQKRGHEVVDLGVNTDAVSADYPDTAKAVGSAIRSGQAERGIVVCGSGVGACIAANKIDGIYAAIAHDTYSAAQGVEHDNMNVLCLGGRVIGTTTAETLVDAFLGAKFAGEERFVRRFNKVKAIEQGDLS
jgi:ribose 5-phosphate isomerase B